MGKKVMVSYLERNRIFELPDTVANAIEFLTSEFLKRFSIDSADTVKVTFPNYDDWKAYVASFIHNCPLHLYKQSAHNCYVT